MNEQRLPRRIVTAYALPGFLAALPIIPVGVLLPSWYARDLGLGLIVTGVVLFGVRLVDFFTDLFVGYVIDRYSKTAGVYRGAVLGGAVLAALALVMLGFPPQPVGWSWLALWTVVLFTGWTVLMVPYTAWAAELATSVVDRTRLTAAREIAGAIGMLLALTAPWLASAAIPGLKFAPVSLVAVFAVGIGFPLLAIFYLCVPEPRIVVNAPGMRWRDVLPLLRDDGMRLTLGCWLTNGVANGLPPSFSRLSLVITSNSPNSISANCCSCILAPQLSGCRCGLRSRVAPIRFTHGWSRLP